MMKYIMQMGPMGLVNVIILSVMTVFILKNAYLLFIKKTHEKLEKLGRSINSMLFWGAIIVILGFIGTFLGFQSVIKAVISSKVDNILVILGGIYTVFTLVIFSLTSFIIISFVWYLFTWQHRRLLERSMKEAYSGK